MQTSCSQGWNLLLDASGDPGGWAMAPNPPTGWEDAQHRNGAHLLVRHTRRGVEFALPDQQPDRIGLLPAKWAPPSDLAIAQTVAQGLSPRARWHHEHVRAQVVLALLSDPLLPTSVNTLRIDPKGRVFSGRTRVPMAKDTTEKLCAIRQAHPGVVFQCSAGLGHYRIKASTSLFITLGPPAHWDQRRMCAQALLAHACD